MGSTSAVRPITGYIYDNEVKFNPEFMDQLEDLEIAMSTRSPFSQIARFCQIIGVRAPPS